MKNTRFHSWLHNTAIKQRQYIRTSEKSIPNNEYEFEKGNMIFKYHNLYFSFDIFVNWLIIIIHYNEPTLYENTHCVGSNIKPMMKSERTSANVYSMSVTSLGQSFVIEDSCAMTDESLTFYKMSIFTCFNFLSFLFQHFSPW